MFKQWGECVKNFDNAKDVATLSCIPIVFLNLLNALLVFVGFFALFLFIFSGYKYMNSGGDAKKLEGARNTLIYGILGLLVVLFSFFIINLISIVTGVKCIEFGQFGFECK